MLKSRRGFLKATLFTAVFLTLAIAFVFGISNIVRTVNADGNYKYEAETYTAMSGIAGEACSEGTDNIGWIDATDWVDYSVNVVSGSYKLVLRYAGEGNANVALQKNSVTLTSVALPATGGWQVWSTMETGTFDLAEGAQTLRLYFAVGGCNLNYFELVKVGDANPQKNLIDNNTSTAGDKLNIVSAIASSIEGDSYVANNAIDGNTATRWASMQGSDTESIVFDLGEEKSVNKVVLNWEAAFGAAYKILVSTDNSEYTLALEVNDGSYSIETRTFNAVNARYVKIQGVTRGLPYGYSLWEVEIYGGSKIEPIPTNSLKADFYLYTAANSGWGNIDSDYTYANTTYVENAYFDDLTNIINQYAGRENGVAIRFNGQITALNTGLHTFYIIGDNGFKLTVGGVTVINNWADNWDQQKSGTVYLEAGKTYDLQLDFFENNGGQYLKLEWNNVTGSQASIPNSLFTVPGTKATSQASATAPVIEEPVITVTPTQPDLSLETGNYDLLDRYFTGVVKADTTANGSGNEKVENLFDNNTQTKFYTSDTYSIQIAWGLSRAVKATSYSLTTANDTATYSWRNPKEWKLFGSLDGGSWEQIDVVSNGEMTASNFTKFTYDIDVAGVFQYFMLFIDSTGGNLQLSEIDLYGCAASASEVDSMDLSIFYSKLDTANTSTQGFNANEVPANLFDGDTTTKLFTADSKPITIAWEMKIPVTVYDYTFITANDSKANYGRNPLAWELFASNDKGTWTLLDAVADGGITKENYASFNYTVDRYGAYKYFKVVFASTVGNGFQLSEIAINGLYENPSEFNLLLTGDWDLVNDENYIPSLITLFYNSYPRLYKRFANGSEPKTITFMADKDYDGVAYCAGTLVCVSVDFANANPRSFGFFSHEITHSVQQYGGKLVYSGGWWTENMANYGGFRYFHWSNPEFVQVYTANDTSLQDWGYGPYGNNKWFFAYMDYRYPTSKNADGSLNYGLIDSINRFIKANNTNSEYDDDPYDTNSPFNKVVKQITGYDCIESLRLRFVEELKNGTWTFEGFGNFPDNFVTENIDGLANIDYPMLGNKTHGNTTASKLGSTYTGSENLVSGATVYATSGYVKDNEQAQYLIDGNLNTKWCANADSTFNATYVLNGVSQWVMIDLGSQKTFDTYTLYNTTSKEGYTNVSEWEILVSNDGETWTSVDYQSGRNDSVSSFTFAEQTARYVFIKVFADGGTLRLYEFQLYNK